VSLLDAIERLDDLAYAGEFNEDEHHVARILAICENACTPLFTTGNGIGTGNLLDDRRKLLNWLGVNSDEEAYAKLLEAEANPGKPKEESNWMNDYKETDITQLPLVKYYELEPVPYMTTAIVTSYDPDTGTVNASIHRVAPISKDAATIRIVPRHLHTIVSKWHRRGLDAPIAISWGTHPLVLLAAATSPPYGINELGIADRLLNGLRIGMLDNGAPFIYGSSYVIEGYITREMTDEGPFVDILGTYDKVRKQPMIRIVKVYTIRDIPVAYYLLPGGAEHRLLMGFEKEAKIWQFVKNVIPGKVRVRLTPGGCGWMHAVISIEKRVEGDAKNAIMAAFAAHPSLKHVLVVDNDIDIDDPTQVEWAIATRFRADRGLIVIPYARGSTLDPVALNEEGLTYKVGIDATRPLDKDPIHFTRAKIPGL